MISKGHFSDWKPLQSQYLGYNSCIWGQRFSPFFYMAARQNHTTSSYHAIVGLTKRSPVIQTQTLLLTGIFRVGTI